LMAYYGMWPTAAVIWLPVFLVFALLSALAVGLWLSALNVQYRDVQYVIPFLVQVWMYASPVAYSATLVPSGVAQVAYGLNPMVGCIQGFRWCLFGGPAPGGMIAASAAMMILLLLSGLYYFQRMERRFADII